MFNIATDKSIDPEFNTMIGLTHKEVLNTITELGINEYEENNIII